MWKKLRSKNSRETLENGGQEILNKNQEVDEDEEWTLKGKMQNL